MENFKFSLSGTELTALVKEAVMDSIRVSMASNRKEIEKSLDEYFRKPIFETKANQFERALDWAVEDAFRDGLHKAMEELNFKEVIAQKAKELLSSDDFITDLATKKVRASLGLPEE